jgi:Family of unknown function (DUF6527)
MKAVPFEDGSGFLVFCPACQTGHKFDRGWIFNGDLEKPTFSPSILVCGVEPVTEDERCRILRGEEIKPRPLVCHSFVREGRIEFLGDCTHALAGQTVDLPDMLAGE